MKKLGLLFSAIAISSFAMAQKDTSKNRPYPPDINKSEEGSSKKYNPNRFAQDNPDSMRNQMLRNQHQDGYTMQNGRMIGYRNGQMTTLEKSITLSNGTTITADGYFTSRAGTKTRLKEGDQLDMTGTLITKK